MKANIHTIHNSNCETTISLQIKYYYCCATAGWVCASALSKRINKMLESQVYERIHQLVYREY